jgi:hypothetical protein
MQGASIKQHSTNYRQSKAWQKKKKKKKKKQGRCKYKSKAK